MSIRMCGPACTNEQKNSHKPCGDPQESFAGCVLDTFERNAYSDSDFYALVWTGHNVTTQHYATTRGWTYHNTAKSDATPAVEQAARTYFLGVHLAGVLSNAADDAMVPAIGDLVLSTTTRGKNKGATGILKWTGPDSYARSYNGITPMRAGFLVEGESKLRYVALENVRRTEPRTIDESEIQQRVTNWVAIANWRSLYEGTFRL